ncbi:MAG TPA: Hsp20/alpha crystallin family protein [Egibacteraceae bacterium]|nr:Hsp20/alpha crystallin family protein [Egibacteraceae bacterium]
MLTRFDPLRDVERMFSSLASDRLAAAMPMDVCRRGDELIVDMDLPGVDRDAISLTVERGVLQVHARREARWREDDQVLVAERPMGEVTRRLALGDGLDLSRVDASYDAGVLRLRIPVAEEAKPHRIPVRLGGEAHAVEANVARAGVAQSDETRREPAGTSA